jgi:ParB/RepB/Spo0J family partition protein
MTQAAEKDVNLGKPYPVRLSRIERYEDQPRKFFNDAGIEALATNIQDEEQETPVKLTTKPGQPGYFILVDGERRWRAFHVIWERTGVEPTVDAFIEVVADLNKHFRKSVIANLHREDFEPLDRAAAYARLLHDGDTVAGIAKLAGKSTSHVESYLKINDLPDEVKVLMDPNRSKDTILSVTSAIDIARGIPQTASGLRISVAQETIERNLGVLEARSLITHKTGKAGYRAGGRLRKPSDDYKVLRSYLGRTRETIARIRDDYDFEDLYLHRDDPDDRKRDLQDIDRIISHFTKLKESIGDVK